jgi:very-short-patch-repair endonuclease
VVTRAQLLDAGLTQKGIEHRLRRRRIHAIHRAVFAVGHPRLTREGRWLAAVLACGKRAVLSYLSAATLWAIWERAEPRRPHVSVPSDNGRRGSRGIELHRTALAPTDVTVRDAIPVTTLARTLVDVASILDARQLKSALRQAERLHQLDLQALRVSLDAHPATSPKHARLRRALDAYVPGSGHTEADVEMAFLELCAKHGLPMPETQVPIGPYRADFMWPEIGLVVEIDDRQSHDGYVAFREDRVRDRTMKAAGLEVLRFTRNEVLRTPARAARELEAAYRRRAASMPASSVRSSSPTWT